MSKLELTNERRSLKFETMPTCPTTRSEIRECVCYDLKVNNIPYEPFHPNKSQSLGPLQKYFGISQQGRASTVVVRH